MEWYKWYPAIYEADTEHLTAEQDGIYRRLIDRYMRTRQPLPDNDNALARIAGVSLDSWCHASAIVKAFFRHTDGKLYHSFCDQNLSEQDEKSKTKSEIGRIGAAKRWQKTQQNQSPDGISHASAIAQPMQEEKRGDKKNITGKPVDVSDQVWSDFLTHRKTKKAPVSETVLKKFRDEALKAGITLEQAMEISILRGWTGINAEWLKDARTGAQSGAKTGTEPPRRKFNPNDED